MVTKKGGDPLREIHHLLITFLLTIKHVKGMKKNSKVEEKRKELKALSKPIQEMVKKGVFSTVNQGLKEIYANEGHKELKTIRQWNRDGMRVKKGERSLLLWGSPRKIEVVKMGTDTVDMLDFYPLCFVFSRNQVTESKKGGKQ